MSENNAEQPDLTAEIKSLATQAEGSGDGGEAMRFSQAACNLANAMACIANIATMVKAN